MPVGELLALESGRRGSVARGCASTTRETPAARRCAARSRRSTPTAMRKRFSRTAVPKKRSRRSSMPFWSAAITRSSSFPHTSRTTRCPKRSARKCQPLEFELRRRGFARRRGAASDGASADARDRIDDAEQSDGLCVRARADRCGRRTRTAARPLALQRRGLPRNGTRGAAYSGSVRSLRARRVARRTIENLRSCGSAHRLGGHARRGAARAHGRAQRLLEHL